MVLVAIVHIVIQILIQSLGFHLAVVVGYGYDLVLCKLHRTSLVHVDMTAAHAYYAFILIQHRVDGGGIGLCASGQEEYLCIGQSAGHAYALLGTLAKLVEAVWCGLRVVVFYEVLQYLRMSPIVVVTFE